MPRKKSLQKKFDEEMRRVKPGRFVVNYFPIFAAGFTLALIVFCIFYTFIHLVFFA